MAPQSSCFGPALSTWALQQIGSYQGDSDCGARLSGRAAGDAKPGAPVRWQRMKVKVHRGVRNSRPPLIAHVCHLLALTLAIKRNVQTNLNAGWARHGASARASLCATTHHPDLDEACGYFAEGPMAEMAMARAQCPFLLRPC